MQDVDAAVAELRRAVGDLGLLGAYIGTDFGIDFDDERLDPFWATAVELDVPVFIHPAPAGIDGPLRDERIRKYDLDLSLGFLFEETLAIACLIYGGVLDRHPDLDICLSHGGGASAFMLGRLEHQGRTRPWAREHPVDFAAAMRRLWFDNHVHDDDSLALLERKVGRDRSWSAPTSPAGTRPTEPEQIPFVDAYDVNARRLLRLTLTRQVTARRRHRRANELDRAARTLPGDPRASTSSAGRGPSWSTVASSSSSNTKNPGADATHLPALTHSSLSSTTSKVMADLLCRRAIRSSSLQTALAAHPPSA